MQASTMSATTLYHDVHEALKHLYDLEKLEESPLLKRPWMTSPLVPSYAGSAAMGWALGQKLTQLIDSLAPDTTEAILLKESFTNEKANDEVAKVLGVSEAVYYRRQKRAINAIVSLILQEEQAIAEREQGRYRHFAEALPSQSYTALVGVSSYLRQVREALSIGYPRASLPVVISGIGGIGKTSLAREALLNWTLHERPDIENLLVVEVASTPELGQRSASYEMENLLLSLGAQAHLPLAALASNEQRLSHLAEHLASHPSVVMIDNIETEQEVEMARTIARQLGSVSQLVFTSRQEFEAPVVRVPTVRPVRLVELLLKDAQELMRLEAERLHIEALAEHHEEAVFERVGGHPLALKLVMGQISVLPVERVLEEFEGVSPVAEMLYKHIYERSWALLASTTQELMLSLLLLPHSGATLTALQIAAPWMNDADINQAVREMSRLNLIQVSPSQPPTYSLHRLTYQFLAREEDLIHDSVEGA